MRNKILTKKVVGVDTSNFAEKADLAGLKMDVHELDIDKLKIIPADLSKLSDVVKNVVVKNTSYDELAKKVNNVDAIDPCNLI